MAANDVPDATDLGLRPILIKMIRLIVIVHLCEFQKHTHSSAIKCGLSLVLDG